LDSLVEKEFATLPRAASRRFSVVDFRAILYDGKYHDVDSSIWLQIAGSLAFKEAMKQARPALLEPVMHVEVYAPDHYSGDLMGDLSGRRGRIAGSESRGHNVIIKGAGAARRNAQLRQRPASSKTQGRASYSMEFFALRLRAQRTRAKRLCRRIKRPTASNSSRRGLTLN